VHSTQSTQLDTVRALPEAEPIFVHFSKTPFENMQNVGRVEQGIRSTCQNDEEVEM